MLAELVDMECWLWPALCTGGSGSFRPTAPADSPRWRSIGARVSLLNVAAKYPDRERVRRILTALHDRPADAATFFRAVEEKPGSCRLPIISQLWWFRADKPKFIELALAQAEEAMGLRPAAPPASAPPAERQAE